MDGLLNTAELLSRIPLRPPPPPTEVLICELVKSLLVTASQYLTIIATGLAVIGLIMIGLAVIGATAVTVWLVVRKRRMIEA